MKKGKKSNIRHALRRLKRELRQLVGKIVKIELFLTRGNFDGVTEEHQELIREQLGHMDAYRDLLSERIELLTADIPAKNPPKK